MPRMHIFNTLEEESFEAPPVFTSIERKKFFDFPLTILDTTESLRTPTNKACFLVMAGYFKSRRRFFAKRFHTNDIAYIIDKLGFSIDQVDVESYDKQSYARHQRLILDFYGFAEFDKDSAKLIADEISRMVRSCVRPKLILLEVLQLLTRRKICIPTYNILANLIVEKVNSHKTALTGIIEAQLSEDKRQLLNSLMEKDRTHQEADEQQANLERYQVTLLKRFSQSLRPSKIKANVQDLHNLRTLYRQIESVLHSLNLTKDGVTYYANFVLKSQSSNVARKAHGDLYLHLITFIAHQYFRLQDTLVDALLASVQSVTNGAQREHKEQYYEERVQRSQTVREFINGLDDSLVTALTTIESIINAQDLTNLEKIGRIKAVLEKQQPVRSKVEENIRRFKKETERDLSENDLYALLEAKSLKLQNRVAEIVKCVEFETATAPPALLEAIVHFKQKGGAIDRNAPTLFLSVADREAIFDQEGKFRVSLYKALFFTKIMTAIKAGTLNLTHSYKYRPLDDYLILQSDWAERRSEYLKKAELEGFADCERTIQGLAKAMNDQYHQTNQQVQNEQNLHIKFRPNGAFHVATPKKEEVECEPLQTFFPEKKYISLLEVLSSVNRASNFLGEFAHWQTKYNRAKPPGKTFFAGIIGLGCDIGQKKIAQISKQIDAAELESTVNWYFSADCVHNANDRIISQMDQMELPNIYRREKETLHTSSDGQKFEVSVDSLNANYSFKYFGQGRGVSVYSFIDERHFLFHSTVISSAEREAAYVIDGLMNNDVVKSDIHSTDTHGYSEVIFGATFLLGFSFAPRIKKLGEQRLYSFQKRKGYEQLGYQILPDGYVDTESIIDNWDQVLRFIATIKLKEATASQLFKRLNSYSKQHPLYRALKEFGKIVKTIFILKYVNDPEFRQAIEKQLNKGESAQKFSKAISFGNNQEFAQSEKEEQEIAEGCRRLIKNAIICWNYLYLAQKLSDEENLIRKAELLESIQNGSVVTWRHINLHGEYDFSDEKMQDTVGLQNPRYSRG